MLAVACSAYRAARSALIGVRTGIGGERRVVSVYRRRRGARYHAVAPRCGVPWWMRVVCVCSMW